MKIPFLKIGKWKNSVDGKDLTFQETDLDQVITATKNRNYQDDKFPICIGHPKTDSPAYGWIKKDKIEKALFKKDEPGLIAFAEDDDLVPEFVEWFGKKLYKNVSVKLRPDYSIRHIAFLGAQPPAVTGLPAISFSDDEEGMQIEFSEYEISQWYFNTLGRIIRRIKNYFVAKEGLDDAEKLLPEYELSDLGVPPKIYEVKKNNISFEELNINKLSEDEMNELEKLKQEKTELETKLADEKKKSKEFQEKLSGKELREIETAAIAFCESDEVKMKIKPAEKSEVVAVIVNLQQNQPIEFSEGEEKKQVNPVEFVKTLIKRLPDVVELGEKFDKGTGDDTAEDIKLGNKMAEMVNK